MGARSRAGVLAEIHFGWPVVQIVAFLIEGRA